MRQFFYKLVLSVLIPVALPVSAEQVENDLTVIPIETGPNLVCGNMAKVVSLYDQTPDCLAPVVISRIDGERQTVPARGFLIEPGIHWLNGSVTLDTTRCHPAQGDQQIGSTEDLAVYFEAGKVYYVAYDRRPLNADERRLVVWKVDLDYPPVSFSQ